MEYINIQPKEVSLIATKMIIKVIYIELNQSAVISVRLYNNDSKLLDSNEFTLSGEEYNDWHDDNYLIDYVCTKYGLTLQNN